jgi:hypothetical protein
MKRIISIQVGANGTPMNQARTVRIFLEKRYQGEYIDDLAANLGIKTYAYQDICNRRHHRQSLF